MTSRGKQLANALKEELRLLHAYTQAVTSGETTEELDKRFKAVQQAAAECDRLMRELEVYIIAGKPTRH